MLALAPSTYYTVLFIVRVAVFRLILRGGGIVRYVIVVVQQQTLELEKSKIENHNGNELLLVYKHNTTLAVEAVSLNKLPV
jgi:hypothetical protein